MSKYKKITIIILTICLVTIISFNSQTVADSIKQSMQLCYNSVIPSLFPFFIICEFFMIIAGGILKNITLTAFITGLISGFPTGVKNICTLYENGDIDRKTATSLLHCTANASPAYLISFIGGCILHSKIAGIILFISQILCAVACGVFFGCFKKNKITNKKTGVISITDAACNSISSSVINCLGVCGFIIFFGMIADLFIKSGLPEFLAKVFFFIKPEEVKSVAVGIIEITRALMMTGAKNLSVAAVITAFSGISVIMQCISCVVKSGLPVFAVIKGKLIYTVLMPLCATCLKKLLPENIIDTSGDTHTPIISFILFLTFILFCIIFIYNIFDKSSERIYNK